MKISWPTKKLGEIIELHYGKGISRFDRKQDGKYPVYGANGVLDYSDKYLVDDEAIIIGRKGSAGEVTRVFGKFWPSDVTYYVLGNENIDIDYLFYLFKKLNLQKLAVGVKPGINRNRVYEIKIPLPPLPEQKRIVKKIEELFAKIDEAKKLRAEAIKDTESLLPSALHKIFSEGEAKGWPTIELNKVCAKTKTGNPSELFKKEFNYIDISSIDSKNRIIKYKNAVGIDVAPSRARKFVKGGDIVFATTRPYLKNIAQVTSEFDNSVASTGFCVLRSGNDELDQDYLFHIISSDWFVEKIIPLQRGATYPAVSDSDILSQEIPIPPIAEQKKIVAELDSLSAKVKQLKELQKFTSADLDALKKSILHQAFNGDL